MYSLIDYKHHTIYSSSFLTIEYIEAIDYGSLL